MVKLFAPAMSLDASGTIANAATFSKWKGRNYLRVRTTPTNPKTGLQVGVRSMFTFLTQQWASLSTADKATYAALAAATSISPFNAYVAQNTQRWKRFLPPAQAYPAAEAGSIAVWGGGQPAAAARRNAIFIGWVVATSINDNWGLAIFRGSTGFTPSLSNCVHVALTDALLTAYSWIDQPLLLGTYYYNSRLITDDGVMGPAIGEISATAT